MKYLYLAALFAAVVCVEACSKKTDATPVANSNIGKVVINGGSYPTIIIGTQTWTFLNYQDGVGSLAITNTYGNYYTLAQAMQITLPSGWRIPAKADFDKLLSTFSAAKITSSGDYVGDISVARALADTAQFHSLISADQTIKPSNSSGFSAFPGGAYNVSTKNFDDQFIGGASLTSSTGTQNGATVNYFFGITSDSVPIGSGTIGYYAGIDYNYANYAYSLRFVKDN